MVEAVDLVSFSSSRTSLDSNLMQPTVPRTSTYGRIRHGEQAKIPKMTEVIDDLQVKARHCIAFVTALNRTWAQIW